VSENKHVAVGSRNKFAITHLVLAVLHLCEGAYILPGHQLTQTVVLNEAHYSLISIWWL